ncbi:MAG: DUF2232 domain-containing protein [Clostridia bacterium]|nr:DUF2232 domain-containing protein [Clostridia bacterium]
MNERKRPVAMVEAGLLTALTIIFTIVGTYVPFLGFFLTIVAIPLTLVGIRHGLKWSAASVVVSGIIGTMLVGITTGVSILLVSGSISLLMTYSFEHKWPISRMVIGASLLSTIMMAITFQLAFTISGINFFDMMDASMVQSMEMMKSMTAGSDQSAEMVKAMELSAETLKIVFPTMLFLTGVFHAVINVAVLKAVMKRFRMPFLPGKPFNEFCYDRSVLIGTSLILILSYLAGTMKIVDLMTLFTNVLLIIAFSFSIQGIAVMDYFFVRRGAKPGMRVFFITLLYVVLNGYILFGIIGWFDVIFNFRKLKRSEY